MSESSTGGTQSGDVSKPFFCYQCDRTVTLSVTPSTVPSCPLCNGGFLEEQESANPNPNLEDFAFPDPMSSFLSSLFFNLQTGNSRHVSPDPVVFDPSVFLQNHLAGLRSGGARIQFVFENEQPSELSGFFPRNLGDYFIGTHLEDLIQQLAENDPNRYGTPPASKSAIESLKTVKVTEQVMDSEMTQCAVCKDEFERGNEVKQMPCKHVYHKECIIPWLELHNSCPVCRYELPTDDPDYESRAAPGAQGSGGGGQGENRTVERSFRISLPWPFGSRGSDSGSSGGSNANAGPNLD
ncbi:zf-RING_2 domain-containing protein/zf-RING_3 domain-containing protein [Cephalotus follicularis]|uniref:RING-type E3 ubiquitin transferase n=1 Tax=Cephalotus follicularis TaxID=3775 RepID=A0A1Q3BWH6_CEPFO|nr:zf-RING_2 domain-containing protein/zf-RING_3 domain-containing protein [Cephalotus follicularis]